MTLYEEIGRPGAVMWRGTAIMPADEHDGVCCHVYAVVPAVLGERRKYIGKFIRLEDGSYRALSDATKDVEEFVGLAEMRQWLLGKHLVRESGQDRRQREKRDEESLRRVLWR